jgi:hypothetical protein
LKGLPKLVVKAATIHPGIILALLKESSFCGDPGKIPNWSGAIQGV